MVKSRKVPLFQDGNNFFILYLLHDMFVFEYSIIYYSILKTGLNGYHLFNIFILNYYSEWDGMG